MMKIFSRAGAVALCSLAPMLSAGGPGLIVAVSLAPRPAMAQRGPAQRVVEGTVETRSGGPLKGAVIYLKDGHNQSVRSAISGDDGKFRFVQLAQSTDYEVWAQADTKRSKSRTISSFDSKPSFNFTLTID